MLPSCDHHQWEVTNLILSITACFYDFSAEKFFKTAPLSASMMPWLCQFFLFFIFYFLRMAMSMFSSLFAEIGATVSDEHNFRMLQLSSMCHPAHGVILLMLFQTTSGCCTCPCSLNSGTRGKEENGTDHTVFASLAVITLFSLKREIIN